MIFYHGSNQEIIKPIINGSNENNDYGPSFYLTQDYDQACLWACKNNSFGIVNKYYVEKKDFESLKILDLTDKSKFSVITWISILMHFRKLSSSYKEELENELEYIKKYYIDVSQYDIVIGFRADDSYFKFPLRFLSNSMSLEKLIKVYELGNLGIQYAFMSKRAINTLKHIESIDIGTSYCGRYYEIVKTATEEFQTIVKEKHDVNDTFLRDIMRNDKER